MKNIFKQLILSLKFLLNKYDLKEIDAFYDAESFGNAYLIVGNKQIMLRFLHDRSQMFVEIKLPAETEWHSLTRLAEYLLTIIIAPLDIEKQLTLFDQNYTNIIEVFHNPTKLLAFKKFEAIKNKEHMLKLFVKK